MKEYKDCTVHVTRCKNGEIDVSWKRNYPIPDEESEDALCVDLIDKPVTVSTEDLSILCICAERYALGRRTYMPSVICKIIKRHMKELSDNDLCVMINYLENPPCGDYGYECDKLTWLNLLEKLKEEMGSRKKCS